ncbi:hypothetical protein TwortDSMZ_137 [Staphylococcus phage Twort]|uniref:Uncharacterized protein n=2 Tax=Staphylococcus phage Twort (strain DSM 17442 / HER 48) TaxID=2908167 RepID=A0A6H0X5E4_BPTWO|nr:hypothetical protein TwortORF089 [Staphylococcus phage Twort]AAX92383.1 ORF089 [Staphylococcus phage Twort]QIW89136.1 hypothetical protein TwortDSMZ_137 [Staphylococcus phage Twort]
MEKTVSTHAKDISTNDLNKWLEAVTTNRLNGKEIGEKETKELQRLGNRAVSLEVATRIAMSLAEHEVQNVASRLLQSVDLIQQIMEDELGIDEEKLNKAVAKLNDKYEAYIKEQQEKIKEAQKKEVETDSNEKVVSMKPKNEQ